MLTTLYEDDNLIVSVPSYLLDENQQEETSEDETEETEPETPCENEETEPEPIIVESNFDESNILMEMESLKQVEMYNLSFNAGIFVFILLYLCVKFFKIFF